MKNYLKEITLSNRQKTAKVKYYCQRKDGSTFEYESNGGKLPEESFLKAAGITISISPLK